MPYGKKEGHSPVACIGFASERKQNLSKDCFRINAGASKNKKGVSGSP